MRDYVLVKMAIMMEIVKNDAFNGVTGLVVPIETSLLNTAEKKNAIKEELLESPIIDCVQIGDNIIVINFKTLFGREIVDFHTQYHRIRKKPYPKDYVFDEDKSVKWNRDEVERQNKIILDARGIEEAFLGVVHREIARCDVAAARVDYKLDKSIPDYAIKNLWYKAFQEYHSCGYYDVKIGFRAYLEMCIDFMQSCN